MKKNIFKSIVPVLLCVSILLSIVGKISAYAVNYSDITKFYVPLTECLEGHPEGNLHYLYAQVCQDRVVSGHPDWESKKYYTLFITFNDNAEYTVDNGNMTFDTSYIRSIYYDYWYYEKLPDRDSLGGLSVGDNYRQLLSTRSFSNLSISEDCTYITINSNDVNLDNVRVNYMEYNIDGLTGKYNSVRVVFTPPLVGDVDRRLNNGGLNSMLGNIKVDIYNDGDTAIQYRLAIYEKNSSSSERNGSSNPDVYYGDDPIFVLYKNEWVYSEYIPDWKWGYNDPTFGSQEIDMGTPMKYQKPSEWHYIPARSGSGYTIKFSQIHFKQGVEYTVKVDCVSCPYENVSSIGIESDRNYGKIDFSTLETVYESDFRILQYDDSEYKPDDDSLGILPYDGYAGNGQANEYSGSYLAYDGGDGNIHYENVKGNSGSNFGSSFFPSQSGTEYNTVISHSTSALGFMSTVLSWFPSDIFTCINIALWFSVILFIIKKV